MKRRTKASLSGNFRRILDKIRRGCKAMRANKIATFDPLIRAISMDGRRGGEEGEGGRARGANSGRFLVEIPVTVHRSLPSFISNLSNHGCNDPRIGRIRISVDGHPPRDKQVPSVIHIASGRDVCTRSGASR